MSDLPAGAGLPRKPRVAVVFGGRSSEHAISCVTAGSVLRALDPAVYDVVPIGIAKDGRWVLESGDAERLAITDRETLPEVDTSLPALSIAQQGGHGELVVHEQGRVPDGLGRVDVVFPVLHGPYGEDGTLQGLLELADVRYVGSGVLASSVSMDKHYMKVVLEAAGLPILPYAVITDRGWRTDPAEARARVDALGYPVFVKPCRGGSSIGISRVTSPDLLDEAVEEARRHDPKVVVEAFAGLGAREIECGVVDGLGDAAPETSVVAEITLGEDRVFYDFEAKYLPGESTRLDVPADLPEVVSGEVRRLAVTAFEALACEGLARVDFFLLAGGEVVVNEVNTMPGFTPTSMFPRMWAATGLDYAALVDRLVALALQRPVGLR